MAEELIGKIHRKLLVSKKTVSVAESCTGGMLCDCLTGQPGASAYFLAGIIAYSNRSKIKLLSVPAGIIAEYGAVSSQVAVSMAENIRKKTGSDLALSVTGIAGPGGAVKNKPVGTVFICLSKKRKNYCFKFRFRGSRQQIRKRSVKEALLLLCGHLSP